MKAVTLSQIEDKRLNKLCKVMMKSEIFTTLKAFKDIQEAAQDNSIAFAQCLRRLTAPHKKYVNGVDVTYEVDMEALF